MKFLRTEIFNLVTINAELNWLILCNKITAYHFLLVRFGMFFGLLCNFGEILIYLPVLLLIMHACVVCNREHFKLCLVYATEKFVLKDMIQICVLFGYCPLRSYKCYCYLQDTVEVVIHGSKRKRTCIAPIVSISISKRSDVDHTELPANTPHLPFLRISIR